MTAAHTPGPYHYAFNTVTGRFYCNGTFDALANDAQLLDTSELAVVRATFDNVGSSHAHDGEPVIDKVIRERDQLRQQVAELESWQAKAAEFGNAYQAAQREADALHGQVAELVGALKELNGAASERHYSTGNALKIYAAQDRARAILAKHAGGAK